MNEIPHKVVCRLNDGTIKKYEVDGVDSAEQARNFVISQVRGVRCVLALVNDPLQPTLISNNPDDTPPLRYA